MSNKTTSPKQIAANQQNATKSTGPRTVDGKQRACLNGWRHGLTGAALILSEEDRVAYEAFTEPIIESLKPETPLERNFAFLIAQGHYRLSQAHSIELSTFALGHFNRASDVNAEHYEVHHALTKARVFDMKGDVFKNLTLYEQRISREMHKNMKALKDLQEQRKAEERQAALEHDEKPKARTAAASATSEENGFGFSIVQPPPQTNLDAPQINPESPPDRDKLAA
jgi:hypothetical protein